MSEMINQYRGYKGIHIIRTGQKYTEYLFLAGVILELIVMMTDHIASWTLPYRGRVTHVAFVLFCIKILMTRYDLKQGIIIALSVLLGVVSYLTCGDEYIIRAVVLVTASVGINMERSLKILFWGTLIGTMIIVTMAFCGVCGDIVDIRHYGRGVEEARFCLGFNHANNVHDILWYLLCLYLLMGRSRLNMSFFVVMTILNLALYVLTRSRTGLIATQIVILGALMIRYCAIVRDGIVLQIACMLSLIMTVFMTIYGSIYNVLESRLVAVIDKYLTGRLEMLTEHANFKEWQVFPAGRSAEFVDNGFSTLVYCYGTVIGLFVIAAIMVEICILIKYRDSVKALILVSAILVTFMESTFVINISLLCNMLLIVFTCQSICYCSETEGDEKCSQDRVV